MPMKSILLLILLISSTFAFADYDAAELQNLFTDKAQRARIDAMRAGKVHGSGVQKTDRVKLSGYVKRSDGRNVVWLNDKNTLQNNRMGNVRVQQKTVGKDKNVTVIIDGRAVRLKPGETWSEGSGVSELSP